MSAGDSIPLIPLNPSIADVWDTDTIQYYLDHRKLLQAEEKKGQDIDLGQKLYALIYSKVAIQDPMLAVMMFQQELLPVTQSIEDDDEAVFASKLDMTTDLNTIVNIAENIFNKGEAVTTADTFKLAYLLLFLTAIPFADDLNSTVVSQVQNAFTDLAQTVFQLDPSGTRDVKQWQFAIYLVMQYLFKDANDGNNAHNKGSLEQIQTAYRDMDQASGVLNSCSKMLGNDANTEVANQETELGGYSKMADMQIGFMRAVNQALAKH